MVHRVAQFGLLVVMLAAIGIGALCIRLAQGPLDLPWFTRRLAEAVNRPGQASQIGIGGVALVWEGFSRDVDTPLELRLSDITFDNARGQRVARIPRAEVAIALSALVRGHLAPTAISVDGAALQAWRAKDGAFTLDIGAATEGAEAGPLASADLQAILHELARPPGHNETDPWGELRRLRLRNAAMVLYDRQLGIVWRVPEVGLVLARRAQGGLDGIIQLDLSLAGQRHHLTGQLALDAAGSQLQLSAQVPALVPDSLASVAPVLAPLAGTTAPVSGVLSAVVVPGGGFPALRADLHVGEGVVHAGAGQVRLGGAALTLSGGPAGVLVSISQMTLLPDRGPPTTLHAKASLSQTDNGFVASIKGDVDQVAFDALGQLWPAGIGGGARDWMVENITSGYGQNARFDLEMTTPFDLSDAELSRIAASADVNDATVRWVPDVPPLEHAAGRVTMNTPDLMEIRVTAARQTVGASGRDVLSLSGGLISLSGLAGRSQFLDVAADVSGAAADAMTLIRTPALHLAPKIDINTAGIAGQVAARTELVRFPLKRDVSMDDVHVRAKAKLTGLRLGGLVAGRTLDGGNLELDVSNDGLLAIGAANIAAIASQVRFEMDFRNGGPAQIVQKGSLTATATAPQIDAAGLDTLGMISGPTGLTATLAQRRDGRGEVAVKANLATAALAVSQLSWKKPPGIPATGEAQVRFDRNQIIGIDQIRLRGADIRVSGQAEYANGKARRLVLDEVVLGPYNNFNGEILFPSRAGDAWAARLSGPLLDASAQFARSEADDAAGGRGAGMAFTVDARLGRVRTGVGTGRFLTDVVLEAANDGRITREAQLSGQAGQTNFDLSIKPDTGGRRLQASSSDAGALLEALGI